jgi:hypothetical protein
MPQETLVLLLNLSLRQQMTLVHRSLLSCGSGIDVRGALFRNVVADFPYEIQRMLPAQVVARTNKQIN